MYRKFNRFCVDKFKMDYDIQAELISIDSVIKLGDTNLVESMISKSRHKDILLKPHNKPNLLCSAISVGSMDMVKLLLDLGAVFDYNDDLLYFVILRTQSNFKLFVEYGFDIFRSTSSQQIMSFLSNYYLYDFLGVGMKFIKILDKYSTTKYKYLSLAVWSHLDNMEIFNTYFAEHPLIDNSGYDIVFWSILQSVDNDGKILSYALNRWIYEETFIREMLDFALTYEKRNHSCILFGFLLFQDPSAKIILAYMKNMDTIGIEMCLNHNTYSSSIHSELLQIFIHRISPRHGYDERIALAILKILLYHNFDLGEILDDLILYSYVLEYKEVLGVIGTTKIDIQFALDKISEKLSKAIVQDD